MCEPEPARNCLKRRELPEFEKTRSDHRLFEGADPPFPFLVAGGGILVGL
jgi:hypothetical protein